MACPCISDVSNMLRDKNAGLITTLFSKPERVVISTYKIDSKKRGKPPSMIASFCPFCGEEYTATATQSTEQGADQCSSAP